MSNQIRVLFVCMGNICRSPTAQGVFEALVEREGLSDLIFIDSAGTHAFHVGEPPDERAREAAARRGVDLSPQRARRVAPEDFGAWDYILAMDEDNLSLLHGQCPDEHRDSVRLFLEFAPHMGEREVPDPYYGGATGFERVLDLVESASQGLLEDIRRQLG